MDKETLRSLLKQACEATALHFSDLYEVSGDVNDFETDIARNIHEAMSEVYKMAGGTSAEIADINKQARATSNMFIALKRMYSNGR